MVRFFVLADFFPLFIEFPALLIVFAGVEEFARVAEAAEAGLFVVFADVGGEVCDCDGADVCGGFDGADGAGGGVGVFLYVGLVVGGAFVCAVGGGRLVVVVVCFCGSGAGCA